MKKVVISILVLTFLVALLPVVSASAKEKSGVEWTLSLYHSGERAIAPSLRAGSPMACADIALKATEKGAKITKITVAVKNSDDETVAKEVVKPQSEEFTLKGSDYVSEKIPFRELKPGKYHYVVSVKVSGNKKAVKIVDEKFTVYSKKKADKLAKKVLADAEAFLASAGYKAHLHEEDWTCAFSNVIFQKNDGWKYVWSGHVDIDCGCIVLSTGTDPDHAFHVASIGTKDVGEWLKGYLKDSD